MNNPTPLWSTSSLQRCAKVTAALVTIIGCLVLVGWLFDINSLKQVLPNLVSMKANTALEFILAGTALFLVTEPTTPKLCRIGRVFSLVVAAIGIATLSEYLFGWHLGIDQLLVADDPQPIGTSHPGRMSLLSAVCFTLVGSALWLRGANQGHPRASQMRWVEGLAIATSSISVQALVAYLYQVSPTIGFMHYTQMAVHTAVCLIVLTVGIVAHPNSGLVGVIAANSAGGTIARRLLPATLAIPISLGWLRIMSERVGLLPSSLGTSIRVVLDITLYTGLISWTAYQLHRVDIRRQAAAKALLQNNNELETRIEDRTTALREANDRLRESEERFRRAILAAPLPIMLHVEGGHILLINQAWTEISGYCLDEIPTIADWTEKAYGSRKKLVQADIDRLYQMNGRVSEGEYTIKTHLGETRIWDFYSAPLGKLSDGRNVVISTAIDITQRKQAEVALQQSLKDLADFKFALEQSAIVAITDAQGSITYVNQKFCELSQYSREELIGHNHRLINSGYHPKAFFQHMWSTITRGQVWRGEIRNRAKDGTFYWVATTIVPFLDASGKPYQYIAVRSDITNRKAAEVELQQLNATLEQRVEERTAQLQDVNKELEAFSYTVAHDLRAPLRGIQGFAQALVEDYGNQLDETAQAYIQYIFEGADRMNELVNDLLTYSRLSREQIKLAPVQLSQVIAEAQAQLEPDLRNDSTEGAASPQKAAITIIGDLPCVMGHRAVLVQIVVNLLSNAAKFVATGIQPQINVWAEVIERDAEAFTRNNSAPVARSPQRVRLWVEDNGIGIEKRYQEQIFGVFERLHGMEVYPGTGIGLAIVRKGAERLGGQAGIESIPGQGSRFWVELRGA